MPDALDIVLNKGLPTPVYLTACSALNSDRVPVLPGVDNSFSNSLTALVSDGPTFPDFRHAWKMRFVQSGITR